MIPESVKKLRRQYLFSIFISLIGFLVTMLFLANIVYASLMMIICLLVYICGALVQSNCMKAVEIDRDNKLMLLKINERKQE